MKFGLIDASNRTTQIVEAKKLQDCYAMVNLKPMEIDHGMLSPELAIVVYEFGLMAMPNSMDFFSIYKQLFAGNAVLYAVNGPDTISLHSMPPVMFYKSSKQAEYAIQRGEIKRPVSAVNGEVLWQWKGD